MSISYINYAVVAVLGGIMAMQGLTDVGSLASYLVFVRQAAMPINQFTQQSNFLLAALAGAERVFRGAWIWSRRCDEGTGRPRQCRQKETDGLSRAAGKTGRWAWAEAGWEHWFLSGATCGFRT